MKKIYVAFCLLLAFSSVKAQYVSINDPLRDILASRYPGCFNGGLMDTTCLAIINEDTLIVRNVDNFLDIDGLQYFKNLKYLDLSNGEIYGQIGQLPSTLETLLIRGSGFSLLRGGHLSSLPALPPGLKTLDCGTNQITNWPAVWPATLEYLDISNNNLAVLPSLPPGLKYLDCSNQLGLAASLQDRVYPILDTLISLPPGLTHLNCSSTSLTALPILPPTLIYLDCSKTSFRFQFCTTGQCDPYVYYTNPGITSLPNWPPQLQYLNAYHGYYGISSNQYNRAFILPNVIPGSIIDLSADSLTSQMILPSGLKYLSVGGQTKCLPYLPASLGTQSPYRTTPENLVLGYSPACLPNAVPGMQVSPATRAYCNVLNNPNNCASNPSITGFVFYDHNSNGVQDPGENPRGGVKVTNDNGVVGFSGTDGVYAAQGKLGSNITTITAPPFYNAVPASINHTLNAADSLVTDTVALQPNVLVDSMRVTITPLGPARRGSDLAYHVKYENVGTTTVNANIIINYDNAVLTHGAGALTLSLNNVTPGQQGEFTSYFVVSTTAAFGAEVHTTATITAGTSTCIDDSYLNVIFSFDPNDKHATPTLTAEQVNSGEFINYLVRFQNVGNDTAFNITITDKLDAKLIPNTLQVIEASHPCATTLVNDYVNFKFSNILLPDSNVNEPASHGYVRFRIKPQPGLPTNSSVPNNAAIYFDFNSPVITNDATTIVSFAIIPLTLLDFNGMVQPGDKVLLSWKTASETNTSKFDIEQSDDGRKFTKVATLPAVGIGDNNYAKQLSLPDGLVYYRLKITDLDGRVSYSNVVKISGKKSNAGFVLLNNPVRSEIKINLVDNDLVNTKASLVNGQGIVLQTFTFTAGVQQFNVSSLPAGLYFLRTRSGTEKIVINR